MNNYVALIIHNSEKSPDRIENVEKLQILFPNNRIIKAIFPDDLTDQQIDFATNPKHFHAMPVLYEKRFHHRLIGRYCCYLSHLKALQYAYEKKIEDVIIFEDDAVLEDKEFDFVKFLSDVDCSVANRDVHSLMYYMGGSINPKNNNIYCLHAYYFPDWQIIGVLINALQSSNNKRAVDSMMINILKKKNIKYAYRQVFGQMQNSYSYIDGSIKNKPGTWVKNCTNAK